MKPGFAACLASGFLACLATQADAEKAPQSLRELQQADLIVVGTISQIRVESERSRIEGALGNYDWGIYVTLVVDAVEQGQYSAPQIEFRCFRIKHRRSIAEYFTPSGHRPLPGEGTRVRAYLHKREAQWVAALPNGITAPDAHDDGSVMRSRLADAPRIATLQRRRYTYVLPLEVWVILAALGTLVLLVVLFTRWMIRRRKVRGRSAR
jgi:hypothetical protein